MDDEKGSMAPIQATRDGSGSGTRRKHRMGINLLLRHSFVIDDSRLI